MRTHRTRLNDTDASQRPTCKYGASKRLADITAALFASVLLLVVLLPQSLFADFERQFSLEADEVQLANLIGEIRVEGHSGKDFKITVRVRGKEATEEAIDFFVEEGDQAKFAVRFPTGEHSRYVYPRMKGGRTSFQASRRDRGPWRQLLDLKRGKIEVRRKMFRGAIELWAEVLVQIPKGKETQVYLGAGSLVAEDIHGDLRMEVMSGSCDAENIEGDLAIDTGSGSVRVKGIHGELSIDTGSGQVSAMDIVNRGGVHIDTGSGGVRVDITGVRLSRRHHRGRASFTVGDGASRVRLSTGSGGVRVVQR